MVLEIFGRKKVEKKLPEVKASADVSLPKVEKIPEIEDMAAKVDLLLAQFERLRIQCEILNTRISEMERILKEIYEMAKSS